MLVKCAGCVLISLLYLQSVKCAAQAKEIALLSRGTWIIDSVTAPYSPYRHEKLISGRDDSTFYQFKAKGSQHVYGYPKMDWYGEQVWGYREDPMREHMVFTRWSCPNSYGFLGKAYDSLYHILVVGEHWPYVAALQITSDSTFMLTAVFEDGDYVTKYFGRIPTPEAMKRD